jgi:hypothetical protein
MRVRFSDPHEFLEELTQDAPASRILRLTFQFQPSAICASVRSMTLVSSYVNDRNEAVQLRHFLGEDWGDGFDNSKATHQRGEQAKQLIQTKAKELGLEVRRGVFEAE